MMRDAVKRSKVPGCESVILAPTTPKSFQATPPGQPPEAAGVRRLEGAQAPSSKPRLTLRQEGRQFVGSQITDHGSRGTKKGRLAPPFAPCDRLSRSFALLNPDRKSRRAARDR